MMLIGTRVELLHCGYADWHSHFYFIYMGVTQFGNGVAAEFIISFFYGKDR